MRIPLYFISCCFALTTGCIKDDFVQDKVDPVLRITSTVDTIALNSTYQFESMYLNNVGVEENIAVSWKSTQTDIASIDNTGLAEALALGTTTIIAEYNDGTTLLSDSLEVIVGNTTTNNTIERTGMIATTSSYLLTGDFVITQNGSDLEIAFAGNYNASTALPGLFIYLTNNPSTTANALEIGPVQVFSGAHSYTVSNTGINDYSHILYFCKPFNVKVGDGLIN